MEDSHCLRAAAARPNRNRDSLQRDLASTRLAIAMIAISMFVPLAGLFARAASIRERVENRSPEPHVFSGIGDYRRKITANSATAQRFFDQGLAFLYGFNREQARLSFKAAAEADHNCAMARWGMAAAFGPDINNTEVSASAVLAANEVIATARDLVGTSNVVERAMIEAMAKRYANPDVADRWPFEEAYSNAMSALAKDRPDDPDIVTLAAESLMVLRAKAFRDTESKRRAPDYGHVLKALAIVLRGCPNHPLALHLWVHALDASPFPEKAAGAADSLRTLAPAIGHLVHMASHIDVRLGRWHQAVLTNEKAIAADHAYRRMEPGLGSHLPSMLHSQHMLAYAAMMEGQSKKAALSVEQLLSRIPEPQFNRRPQDVDVFVAMPYEVHMRFGQWDAMIAEPRPAERFPFAKAMWHFARGVAFAAKHEVTAAKGEQKAFIAAREDVPKDLRFRTLRVAPLLDIAERLLAGEILYRERNVDQAIEALRQGVKREDELAYVEPPLWVVPVRHALGAALMDSGRCTEAEVVYREDLVQHPENGWALYGLARSLQKQGKHAETALVRSRFETAWQHADFKLSSSCCCLPEGRAADQSDGR